MNRMLNLTLPVEGILALRNALGEEQAIAFAHAIELAQIRGEAELAATLRQDWQKESVTLRQEWQREAVTLRQEWQREAVTLRQEWQRELAATVAPVRDELQELRREIAELPRREELKRFATHEDLGELRSQFLRLDKKMTIGFLTLLALNLTSNAPLFVEWGTKVVGYALK